MTRSVVPTRLPGLPSGPNMNGRVNRDSPSLCRSAARSCVPTRGLSGATCMPCASCSPVRFFNASPRSHESATTSSSIPKTAHTVDPRSVLLVTRKQSLLEHVQTGHGQPLAPCQTHTASWLHVFPVIASPCVQKHGDKKQVNQSSGTLGLVCSTVSPLPQQVLDARNLSNLEVLPTAVGWDFVKTIRTKVALFMLAWSVKAPEALDASFRYHDQRCDKVGRVGHPGFIVVEVVQLAIFGSVVHLGCSFPYCLEGQEVAHRVRHDDRIASLPLVRRDECRHASRGVASLLPGC